MLGRLSHWFSTKLTEKGDEHLTVRYDALARLKEATLAMQQTAEERAQASGDCDPRPVFTAEDACVMEFCTALEECVTLGLRQQHRYDREMAWWNVLYLSTLVVDEPTLVQGIQTAATLCESDAGKARCWMKLALNNHTIESSLLIIFSMACEQVVRTSYEDWALTRCSEALELFLHILEDIHDMRFCITVDDSPFTPPTPSPPAVAPLSGIYPDGRATDDQLLKSDGDATAPTTPWRNPSHLSISTGMQPISQMETLPVSPLAADVTVAAEKLGQQVDGDASTTSSAVDNEDELVEVSSVVFPHRHKGIRPWQHIFGVGMAHLSRNPYHCRFALIDPALAIPNLVQDCVDVLYAQPGTPRLFRTTVLHVTINQLREFVETEGALPSDIDGYGAGAILLDYFKNLPESLLTTEKYDAFVASGRLRDDEASIRNIMCLIQDLPVHCRVVLEKVMGVFHFLLLPEHAAQNGLDLPLASSMLAPVIAFKSEIVTTPAGQHTILRTRQHHEGQGLRFAAVGAQVVERMIEHYDVIFHDVRMQVSEALDRLETKKEGLRRTYQQYKMAPQVDFVSDREHLDLVSDVFTENVINKEARPVDTEHEEQVESIPEGTSSLEPVKKSPPPMLKHRVSSPSLYSGSIEQLSSSSASMGFAGTRTGSGSTHLSNQWQMRVAPSTTRILAAQPVSSLSAEEKDRLIVDSWQKHGFNRPTILGNFEKGGVLLLRCVVYLAKNDSALLDRLYLRALPTVASSYDAGLVAAAICKSLLNLLKLVPAPDHPTINIVALSVEPFWELFEEESYFVKLFHLMFQIFDQLWSSLHPDEASFTRVFCDTEARMKELLKTAPSSVDDLRAEWETSWLQAELEASGLADCGVTATQDMMTNAAEAAANAMSAAMATSTPAAGVVLPPSPPRASRLKSFSAQPEDYTRKLLSTSHIWTPEHVACIDQALPITCQLCNWFLLYSSELHGSSLHTLLMLAKTHSPTLIVVKDDQGNVFGGFGSDEWHRSTQYFGNGETFLFSFSPRTRSTSTVNNDVVTSNNTIENSSSLDVNNSQVSVASQFVRYTWSRRNNYFMLCSEDSLVMGGGGSFGLYLNSDLSGGTTGPCETFSSRPLVSTQEFTCLCIEVWGFTTDDKNPLTSRPRKKRSVLE